MLCIFMSLIKSNGFVAIPNYGNRFNNNLVQSPGAAGMDLKPACVKTWSGHKILPDKGSSA